MRALAGAFLVFFCFVLQGDSARLAVTVTAYSSGTITASGTRVRLGDIALSRDVERKYRLRFGADVELLGLGRFVFQDRMHKRWTNRADIFMPSAAAARQFGIKHGILLRLPSSPGRNNSLD
jgi:3D (Asp-Asp-Asp) domain-containing protein